VWKSQAVFIRYEIEIKFVEFTKKRTELCEGNFDFYYRQDR